MNKVDSPYREPNFIPPNQPIFVFFWEEMRQWNSQDRKYYDLKYDDGKIWWRRYPNKDDWTTYVEFGCDECVLQSYLSYVVENILLSVDES